MAKARAEGKSRGALNRMQDPLPSAFRGNCVSRCRIGAGVREEDRSTEDRGREEKQQREAK
jgi:hypothetical protein